MRTSLRVALGCAGIALAAFAWHLWSERADELARCAADLPYEQQSQLAPLELPIPFLYQPSTAPSPGRRVIVGGGYEVRDTIRFDRPITFDGREMHTLPEGLVFLRDSVTDDRIVILSRLDRIPSRWVEVMPFPADPTVLSHVRRWTPARPCSRCLAPRLGADERSRQARLAGAGFLGGPVPAICSRTSRPTSSPGTLSQADRDRSHRRA